MALNGAADYYADTTITEIVALLATEHGGGFDEDTCRENLEPIVKKLELMVRTMLGDARVAFVSGDFAGADSNSDTPDTITATGGVIA